MTMAHGNAHQAVPIETGSTATEGFGSTTLTKTAETAMASVAATAQAAIQARVIMAMKNPRDLDVVRQKLLKEARRPGFARVARYHKPVGKGVEGPSIRFAETAIRCMTNVAPETQTIFDSAEKRIIKVTVSDLEANIHYGTEITIDKTVERSKVPEGMKPIGSRVNSYGKVTYLVAATEDDLLNKTNALISKAIRTNGMRLIPGDIVDEVMAVVIETLENEDAKDPDAARKRLVDAFAAQGVTPAMLGEYLGHPSTTMTVVEGKHLVAVLQSLKDGETTWAEVIGAKKNGAAAGEAPGSLKDRVKQKAEAAKASATKSESKQDIEHAPTQPAPSEPTDAERSEIERGDNPDNY